MNYNDLLIPAGRLRFCIKELGRYFYKLISDLLLK